MFLLFIFCFHNAETIQLSVFIEIYYCSLIANISLKMFKIITFISTIHRGSDVNSIIMIITVRSPF